jgi:hypothetical protein
MRCGIASLSLDEIGGEIAIFTVVHEKNDSRRFMPLHETAANRKQR